MHLSNCVAQQSQISQTLACDSQKSVCWQMPQLLIGHLPNMYKLGRWVSVTGAQSSWQDRPLGSLESNTISCDTSDSFISVHAS